MRFSKIFRFDIQHGFCSHKSLLLAPVILAISIFMDFIHRLFLQQKLGILGEKSVALGDCWFYIYGGIKEYIPSPEEPFLFPILWMLVFLLSAFLVLQYPFETTKKAGQHLLVRSQSRISWWISKCLWNLLSTLYFHGMLLLIVSFLCFCFRIPMSLQLHMDFQQSVLELGPMSGFQEKDVMPFVCYLLPILVSMTMNMLQMTISLFVKPFFGFLTLTILLLVSCYVLNPLLPGNYGMLLRGSWLFERGVSEKNGFLFLAILLMLSVITGVIKFSKYDIFDR